MVEPIRGWLVVALVAVGCFFLTVGTVGLLRLPNVYNRMHATSKPTTLGTAAIFLASFVRFGPGGYGLPSLVGILFLFLSVPTGAHMISRAAQQVGVPFLGGVTWPDRSERPTRSEDGTRSDGAERPARPEDGTRSGDSGEGSEEREAREKSPSESADDE